MRPLSRLLLALLLALTGALSACSDGGGDDAADVELQDREGEESDDQDDDTDTDTQDPDDEEPDDQDDTDDGEATGDADAYVDALAATFADDEATPVPADDARCVSTRIVEIAGVDRLVDAGISPQQFADEADLSTLGLDLDAGFDAVDAFGECGVDLRGLMVESFSADADDPETARACIEAALPADAFREFMARSLVEGDEFEDSPEAEAFFAGIFACSFGSLEG